MLGGWGTIWQPPWYCHALWRCTWINVRSAPAHTGKNSGALRAAVSVTLAYQKATSLASERCVTHNNMGPVTSKWIKPQGSQPPLTLVACEGAHYRMTALIGSLFLSFSVLFRGMCRCCFVFPERILKASVVTEPKLAHYAVSAEKKQQLAAVQLLVLNC